jgi:hypothetical protein
MRACRWRLFGFDPASDRRWLIPTSARSGIAPLCSWTLQKHSVTKAKVEIVRTVFGFSGVTVILHNTAAENGRVLDEHLAAVFTFRDDNIGRLDTYLSDGEMVSRFFG